MTAPSSRANAASVLEIWAILHEAYHELTLVQK